MNVGLDLAEAARRHLPPGATVRPAAFARDDAPLWTLAKLIAQGPPMAAADRRSVLAWLYGDES